MDKFQRSSLDNYITGHYGEDQLRDEPQTSSAFEEGQLARDEGIPMNSNPYEHGSADYNEWAFGWSDEDSSLRVPEEE